jgi:peptide/nickel transport system permease protein
VLLSHLLRYLFLTLAVIALNFVLPRVLPGDPLGLETADGMTVGAGLPAETRAQLRDYYGLDEPLHVQAGRYLGGLLRLDLGWSISQNAPVARLLAERLPWTLALVLTATVIAASAGTLAGVWAAWRGGRWSRTVVSATSALASLPEFLIAMALMLVFAIWLPWLPVQGGRTAFAFYPGGPAGILAQGADIVVHLALPATTLVLSHSAAFILLAHGSMRGTLGAPYLAAARAKGLGEAAVALRHALPNALLPLLTLFALRAGLVFSGAVVVERVFAVPGVGLLAVQAVRARDYPVMQAVFLLASLTLLATSFLAELLYARVDPRVRERGR